MQFFVSNTFQVKGFDIAVVFVFSNNQLIPIGHWKNNTRRMYNEKTWYKESIQRVIKNYLEKNNLPEDTSYQTIDFLIIDVNPFKPIIKKGNFFKSDEDINPLTVDTNPFARLSNYHFFEFPDYVPPTDAHFIFKTETHDFDKKGKRFSCLVFDNELKFQTQIFADKKPDIENPNDYLSQVIIISQQEKTEKPIHIVNASPFIDVKAVLKHQKEKSEKLL